MKGRLAWSDLRIIRDVIAVLATQGWQKSLDEEDCENDNEDAEKVDPLEPMERLGVQFKIPLESAGVDISKLRDEFYDMMLYATQFISLSTLDYRAVWWRLFHSPNSSSWPNVLSLSRLLFSLPVSNGKLERIFSVLKLIKVNRRSSLGNETLKDLLMPQMVHLWRTLILTHVLICGGKLDQTRRREKSTTSEKVVSQKLKTAAVTMTHFCWMTGIIGWMIPKHDLCN